MRREMRRKNREISKECAYDIIRSSEYGFLSTVSEDGSPYCIAISHALVGNKLFLEVMVWLKCIFTCLPSKQKMQ